MGIFSKAPAKQQESPREAICKLCGKSYAVSDNNTDLCPICLTILDVDIDTLQNSISTFQECANNAFSPDEKIGFLRLMLDALFEFKVKYIDNGVNPIEQDMDKMIDEVVECISQARL